MRLVCLSDLHGHLPEVPEADVVCIVGDVSPVEYDRDVDKVSRWMEDTFVPWVDKLPCRKVCLVWGNHDFVAELRTIDLPDKVTVLQDSSIDIDGIIIYGSPWTPRLSRWAFYTAHPTVAFDNIPKCDVLLTHCPPRIDRYGTVTDPEHSYYGMDFGSGALVEPSRRSRLHLFGHVHTGDHRLRSINGTYYRNVSILDEDYDEVYRPAVIDITQNTINEIYEY